MGAITSDRVARYVELIDNPDTLDVIAQRVAEGEGLPALCATWDVPYGRVLTWLMADVSRYQVYLRALELHAHKLVSETVPLADGVPPDKEAVAKASLQVNTRFRVAKHHAPSLYAEKVEVKHSGTVTFSHALSVIAQRRLAAKAEREPVTLDVTPTRESDVL